MKQYTIDILISGEPDGADANYQEYKKTSPSAQHALLAAMADAREDFGLPDNMRAVVWSLDDSGESRSIVYTAEFDKPGKD